MAACLRRCCFSSSLKFWTIQLQMQGNKPNNIEKTTLTYKKKKRKKKYTHIQYNIYANRSDGFWFPRFFIS